MVEKIFEEIRLGCMDCTLFCFFFCIFFFSSFFCLVCVNEYIWTAVVQQQVVISMSHIFQSIDTLFDYITESNRCAVLRVHFYILEENSECSGRLFAFFIFNASCVDAACVCVCLCRCEFERQGMQSICDIFHKMNILPISVVQLDLYYFVSTVQCAHIHVCVVDNKFASVLHMCLYFLFLF